MHHDLRGLSSSGMSDMIFRNRGTFSAMFCVYTVEDDHGVNDEPS
jgi:hypothetical protein